MFLHLYVILFTGEGVSATPTGTRGRHPQSSACWDTHLLPSACRYTCPPLGSACWDTVNKQVVCIHWNAFLYYFNINFVNTMKRKHSSRMHAAHLLTICALGWLGGDGRSLCGGQNDGQTRLKTLRSHSFVGGR